jgi:polyisoprenoid-binding protein YceI
LVWYGSPRSAPRSNASGSITAQQDLNQAPLFVRPRVTVGLSDRLTLTMAGLPPVRFFGATPRLFALGIGWKMWSTERWILQGRAHGQLGTVTGAISCPPEILAFGPGSDGNPTGCERQSADAAALRYMSIEFDLARRLTRCGRLAARGSFAVNVVDGAFQTNARTFGFLGRTRLASRGLAYAGRLGLSYALGGRTALGRRLVCTAPDPSAVRFVPVDRRPAHRARTSDLSAALIGAAVQRTPVFIVHLLLPVLVASSPAARAPTTFAIDPGASRVVIHVAKSGLLSFLGHTHEVAAPVAEGTVVVHPDDVAQSTVRVEFDAAALRVTGKGEPAGDVAEVQRTMESERVLDVSRFPHITFASRDVRVIARSADHVRLRVTGDLTLHGVTMSEATEVSADIAPERLTATGSLRVKQTDFGIEPVTAGAGTVRVKNELDIEFTLVARPAATSPARR